MSQLFSRVFLQILDSSIAEDWVLRHVFEDFLKLADYKTGVVDMTRPALSRRLNIPLDVLNEKINKLESEDVHSRDPENDGRRLERLDDHRDWGWRIINHEKYDKIRCAADNASRVQKHRASKSEVTPEAEDKFEKFWAAYPRKVSKVDAKIAFVKALEKTTLEQIISSITTHKKCEQWSKDNGQFIPHAATWLNREGWNDETKVVLNAKPAFPVSLAEVKQYAKEKYGDQQSHVNWAVSFHQYMMGPKRTWSLDDWKIKFGESVNKWKSKTNENNY